MTIINTTVNTVVSTVDFVNNVLDSTLNAATSLFKHAERNEDAEQRAAIERSTMGRNAQATARAIDSAHDQLANHVKATALEQMRPKSGPASGSVHFGESAAPGRPDDGPARIISGAVEGIRSGSAAGAVTSTVEVFARNLAAPVPTQLLGPGTSQPLQADVPATLGARLAPNAGSNNVGSHQKRDLQIGVSIAAAPPSGQPDDPAVGATTTGGRRVAAFGPSVAADAAAVPGSPMRPASGHIAAEAQVARHAAAIADSYRATGEGDAARELRARARDLPAATAGETALRSNADGTTSLFGRAESGSEHIARVERLERWDGAAATRPESSTPATAFDRGVAHRQGASDLFPAVAHAEHVGPVPSTTTDAAAEPAFSIQPASEHALAQAQVARRAAAIALAYRAFGEVDAARELRARTRDLSPALAGDVMTASRSTVEGIISAFGRTGGGGERIRRVERIERWDGAAASRRPDATTPEPMFDRSTRHGQIAADLATTVEHVGRGRRGEPIAHDTASYILDTLGYGDDYGLSLFALGIPFGTGLLLPLALADELDRRGDQQRKRQILVATEQGLRRLQERIAATVGALIELTLPLVGFLSTQPTLDAGDRNRVSALVREYASCHPQFLGEFEALRGRIDAVGSDVFFALDALAGQTPIPAELASVRGDLLASPATAFVIAQSATAQDAAIDRSKVGEPPPSAEHAPALTIERARRVYAALGFSNARSALLAAATVTWHRAELVNARRTIAFGDRDRQSRAVEALLRLFGAAWGLPLFRSREQGDWM